MAADVRKPVRFTTHESLPLRLVLATLTGRPIYISQIRSSSVSPGLASHEISFLRLLESLTNGSHIEISYTGTSLLYRPGLITGSSPGSGAISGTLYCDLPGDCERGISYFLIPICLLAPFSKSQFDIHFRGPGVITSSSVRGDISADSVKTAIVPLYALFGISNSIELKILRRSNAGSGGKGGAGEVQLIFGHQIRLPKTLHLLNAGKVKRIRGVAYCCGVSSSNNARAISSARGVLNPLSVDTYVFSESTSAPLLPLEGGVTGERKKIGFGFGLSLIAETSTGTLYSADAVSSPSGGSTPEEIGRKCAFQLLEAISEGGVVSSAGAPTVLTLMSMGPGDAGRLVLGKEALASRELIQLARDLKAFGAGGWGVRDLEKDSEEAVIVTIVGRGVRNLGSKIA